MNSILSILSKADDSFSGEATLPLIGGRLEESACFLGIGVGCEHVTAGEEDPGAMSTWEASSPSSQDVEEAFDVERLWLGVLDECLVRDFVQAWMPRALPLLVVLDSLPFRGIVELLKPPVSSFGQDCPVFLCVSG